MKKIIKIGTIVVFVIILFTIGAVVFSISKSKNLKDEIQSVSKKAVQDGNVSLCYQLPEKGTIDGLDQIYPQSICISNVAAGTHNSLLCNNIDNLSILKNSRSAKPLCITQVAMETGDIKICNLIEDAPNKASCMKRLTNN